MTLIILCRSLCSTSKNTFSLRDTSKFAYSLLWNQFQTQQAILDLSGADGCSSCYCLTARRVFHPDQRLETSHRLTASRRFPDLQINERGPGLVIQSRVDLDITCSLQGQRAVFLLMFLYHARDVKRQRLCSTGT